MGFQRLNLLYHTVKYLKGKQIFYRLYYAIRNRLFDPAYQKTYTGSPRELVWKDGIVFQNSYLGQNTFSFLNIIRDFNDNIDWNFGAYGKLWTYNLNYFDFLNQKNIPVQEGLGLLYKYLEQDSKIKDGKEPYPISLRAINWIKFLSKNRIKDAQLNQLLYNHYQVLLNNLEYHILGNHLLENAFSLLFGAVYFNEKRFWVKADIILRAELEEQILDDGAHFELSSMYHRIILHRLLDCINLLRANTSEKSISLLPKLEGKAVKMVSWLAEITFGNGAVPMVNDSAFGIASTPKELIEYAGSLGIRPKKIPLSESGYRKFSKSNYECFIDVGQVGPAYQPGHAHADTFNFVLHVDNKPIIVDPGVSTYNINEIRERERSTAYHNTVTVNGQNSSQVWAGFRVGKRAEVTILEDEPNSVSASHNGFKNCNHQRNFIADDNVLLIQDFLEGNAVGTAYFHCHPGVKVSIDDKGSVKINNTITLAFTNFVKVKIEKYHFANGYNTTILAKKIKVVFKKNLSTQIKL